MTMSFSDRKYVATQSVHQHRRERLSSPRSSYGADAKRGILICGTELAVHHSRQRVTVHNAKVAERCALDCESGKRVEEFQVAVSNSRMLQV